MRISIGERGIGGRNESWYYLEFDEEECRFYHVKEWHNMDHRLNVNEGKERTPLENSRGLPCFQEAVTVIKNRLFLVEK